MPGCEKLERIAENEYAMKMKMALASMSGVFDGKVSIADVQPPDSYRLVVEGKGKIGFMRGEGVLNLSDAAESTKVAFDGDVQVGGMMAGLGQRLIDSTARMLIKRFFNKLAEEAKVG